jgi:hypothetical protein
MDRKDDRAVFSRSPNILDQHDQDDSFMRLITHHSLEGHEPLKCFTGAS